MMTTAALPLVFFGLAMAGVLTQNSGMIATQVGLIAVLALLGSAARRLMGYGVTQVEVWTQYLPTVGQ